LIQQERENSLSFTLNSHVGAQIIQRTLRENAVTRPAQHNRGLGQTSTIGYDRLDRREQEPGFCHVLVIDVSHRNPDDVRAEVLDGVLNARVRIFFEHQVQQDCVVASAACCGRHVGSAQWEGGHTYRIGVGGNQENPHDSPLHRRQGNPCGCPCAAAIVAPGSASLNDVTYAVEIEPQVAVLVDIEGSSEFRAPHNLIVAVGIAGVHGLAETVVDTLDKDQEFRL